MSIFGRRLRSKTPLPQHHLWMHAAKTVMSNCYARSLTSSKNAAESVKIQKFKHDIVNRQKAFGVQYMKLVESKAPAQELELCVGRAMEDIAVLQEKLSLLQGNVEKNKRDLQRRISGKTSVRKSNKSANNNNNNHVASSSVSIPTVHAPWSSATVYYDDETPNSSNPPPSAPFEPSVY